MQDVTTPLQDQNSQNQTSPCKLKNFHLLTCNDDLECYLVTFERVCVDQNILPAKWTIKLKPFLTRKAQKAVHLLTDSQRRDFSFVKETILHAYKLIPDSYREKFRRASKLSSEAFREHGGRLHLYL